MFATDQAAAPHYTKPSRTSNWGDLEDRPLDAESLDALFQNRVPAIRVRNFLNAGECQTLVNLMQRHAEFQPYVFTNSAATIMKIGPAQCEFGAARKAEYFAQGERANVLHNVLRQEAFNPLDRVRGMLTDVTGVRAEVPSEPGYGAYFAGVFRNISKGAYLHLDYAPLDAPGWAIGNVREQISWNLYLRAPRLGGEALVYDLPWQAEHEAYKLADSYHYSHELVRDAIVKINPFVVGDLVFFNSRNYHSVTTSVGERFTMSSFVGRRKDGNLVLWS